MVNCQARFISHLSFLLTQPGHTIHLYTKGGGVGFVRSTEAMKAVPPRTRPDPNQKRGFRIPRSILAPKALSQFQPAHQWRLLPQGVRLLVRPLCTFLAQFQVKVPKHTCEYHAHLCICEVSSDTIAWSCRKRLHNSPIIRVEWRTWITLSFW